MCIRDSTLAAYNEYAVGTPAAVGGGLPGRGTELVGPFARRLGLTAPSVPWHALRTPFADLGAVLSFTAGALGKLAVDVQGLARTEVAEAAEPSGEGRGASSAMPQKRNPVLATLIASAARQVPPLALVLTQALVSEDERAAGGWHAEWQPLRECLRLTAGAADSAAELAAGLTVFPKRMRANLESGEGELFAERLNALLAPTVGKAAAKRLLARLSAEAAGASEAASEVTEARAAAAVSYTHLDVYKRQGLGGGVGGHGSARGGGRSRRLVRRAAGRRTGGRRTVHRPRGAEGPAGALGLSGRGRHSRGPGPGPARGPLSDGRPAPVPAIRDPGAPPTARVRIRPA